MPAAWSIAQQQRQGDVTQLAFPSAVQAGNLLLSISVPISGDTLVPTDTQGNTYTLLGTFLSSNNGGSRQNIFACIASAGGPNTVTTFNLQTEWSIVEFSAGAPLVLTQDGAAATADAPAGSSASITVPSFTPTQPGDLLINYIAGSSTFNSFNGVWVLGDITTNHNAWGYTTAQGTSAVAANATELSTGSWQSLTVAVEATYAPAAMGTHRMPMV